MPIVNEDDNEAFVQWLVDTGRIEETIEELPEHFVLKSQDSVRERFNADWLDYKEKSDANT